MQHNPKGTRIGLFAYRELERIYVLVDNHFKEKKQVQAYAALLHRSPKTLSNLFAAYGMPSPLK